MNTSYYFDTSAIVKRYAQETGTDWVQTTVAFETGNVVLIAEIGMVEVAAAFARMQRRGRISEQKQADYLQLFLKDTDEQYRIALLDSHTIRRAIDLTQQHKLRGYDAVHLATALILNETLLAEALPPLIFITADANLLAAAGAEGLAGVNPAMATVSPGR